METTFQSFVRAASVVALMLAMGCATAPAPLPQPQPDEFAGAPRWVTEDCRLHVDMTVTTKLCGVGSFAGSNNISLARTAAVTRGRSEIARSLGTKLRAILSDEQMPGAAAVGKSRSHVHDVAGLSKRITDRSLANTEVRDTWVSNSGAYYTLVVLDVEKFEESVNGMHRLNANVRRAISERAKASFAHPDDAL